MQNCPNDALNINNFWRINWYSNHISRIYKLNVIIIITNYKKLINLEQARKKRFEVSKFWLQHEYYRNLRIYQKLLILSENNYANKGKAVEYVFCIYFWAFKLTIYDLTALTCSSPIYSFSLPWKQVFWYFQGIEQGYIRRKWVKGRPYNWKPFKIGEKCFLFHDKNFLFLRYLYFYLDFLVMWKKPGLIRKLRLILKLMTSQTEKQVITINILLNISRTKDNKTLGLAS